MLEVFDVIVIGGGPSGMMAAGQASLKGARVLLLEKNNRLGKKLLLTGNERCNLTQAQFNLRTLVKCYGDVGKFLFSAFSNFGPKETMKFFETIGVKLKTEPNGRVFPKNDSAREVVNALEKFLYKAGVKINLEANVKKIFSSSFVIPAKAGIQSSVLSKSLDSRFHGNDNKIWEIELINGQKIQAKNLIIATGGLSYPHTGSTGAGLEWARSLGHKITDTVPALVPISVKEKWIENLRGVSVKDAKLFGKQAKKIIVEERGQILFTHFGLSGPTVLNASKKLILGSRDGEVEISINFFPDFTKTELDKKLQTDFKKEGSKLVKNVLDTLSPHALVEKILELAKIKNERKAGEITKIERVKIVDLLTDFKLTMAGNLGFAASMVTGGGVTLAEVDQKTMRSKIHDNLYFTGEVLDIDGPTGGYNLQIAWSTGFTAGNAIHL